MELLNYEMKFISPSSRSIINSSIELRLVGWLTGWLAGRLPEKVWYQQKKFGHRFTSPARGKRAVDIYTFLTCPSVRKFRFLLSIPKAPGWSLLSFTTQLSWGCQLEDILPTTLARSESADQMANHHNMHSESLLTHQQGKETSAYEFENPHLSRYEWLHTPAQPKE